jgi:hypothetical protein
VIIDRKTLRDGVWWIAFSLIALIAGAVAYVVSTRGSLAPPSGGSPVGLALGSAGMAMITFCMLLAFRKHFRSARLGRVYMWMHAHIWLGLVSYPIILLHAGFHWGGPLTCTLMWLFTIVELSGIFGLVLQQILPKEMFGNLDRETIYRQIEHRTESNLLKAKIVVESCRLLAEAPESPGDVATMAAPVKEMIKIYDKTLEPYLSGRMTTARADRLIELEFDSFRRSTMMADAEQTRPLQTALTELEDLVRDKQTFDRQRRLQNLLHGWLFVHVPLSYALFFLAIAHAVMAVRY